MRLSTAWLLILNLLVCNVQAAELSFTHEAGKTTASLVADTSQVHSGQILAEDADSLWRATELWLRQTKTESAAIAKLNLYASSAEDLKELEAIVVVRFAQGKCPPLCSVVTPLPDGKKVALDLVAVSSHQVRKVVTQKEGLGGARILPPGKRIYISGQAARSEDLLQATKETIVGLLDSVNDLNRNREDIVSLKAFVNDMSKVDVVYDAVTEIFGAGKEPPLVCVQWQSSDLVPVEIEMIVWGGKGDPALPVLEYKTVLELAASPVFSRVCQINSGHTIYIAGISSPADDGVLEVKQTYGLLAKTLAATNSDMKHLVKATYYVSDGATSSALGSLRTKIYSPTRPPAASKAMVPVIGFRDQRFLMDMIAVPAPQK